VPVIGQSSVESTAEFKIEFNTDGHDVRREITGGQWVVIEGHGLDRTLALAMAQTDFPRKMTESIADFRAPT
jgi:hypothetical protein